MGSKTVSQFFDLGKKSIGIFSFSQFLHPFKNLKGFEILAGFI